MDATSTDYARAAFDLIDDFEHTKTPEEVVEHLASTLSVFGFSTILITGVPEPPQRVEPYFLMNGWPRRWSDHNAKANTYADDPAAAWCRRTIDPFEWSEGTGPEQDAGMPKRYLVPVIRATGSTSCVTMAGERPELESRARRAVYMLSLYAHARAVSLLDCTDGAGPRRELTLREREVLHWIAAGKSSWDVSVILGISERTVNWLISRASRKLNAVNRTHAVVNAIRAGQIYI
ncbi:MAG TPA: LuxR C-terminal-related transcriptional regulator [Xanthobacteraceae bacterium]|jgi:LuxR family quorum sensing-dependent transcriptional regulator|nr:LuxR C-terminal-related transcriptional regulator [Xanthobacteraceae bacterium]